MEKWRRSPLLRLCLHPTWRNIRFYYQQTICFYKWVMSGFGEGLGRWVIGCGCRETCEDRWTIRKFRLQTLMSNQDQTGKKTHFTSGELLCGCLKMHQDSSNPEEKEEKSELLWKRDNLRRTAWLWRNFDSKCISYHNFSLTVLKSWS